MAGPWLKEALDGLRGPEGLGEAALPRGLLAELRPYQAVGVRWLSLLQRLGTGRLPGRRHGARQDRAGPGAAARLKERPASRAVPPCSWCPASLIANWKAEIDRFAPSLRVLVAHPSEADKPLADIGPDDLAGVDLIITTYALTHRLRWLAATEWPLVVLDEAQAIKNPGAKQAQAVKALAAQEPRRAHRHARREPPRRPLVALRLPEPRPARLRQGVRRVRQAARRARSRLRAAPRADAPVHPAAAQDRPAGHRRPAGQDRAPRVLRAEPRAGRALPGIGEDLADTARAPRSVGGHRAPGHRARVSDALQADLQSPVAVARGTARGRPRRAASSRACASWAR